MSEPAYASPVLEPFAREGGSQDVLPITTPAAGVDATLTVDGTWLIRPLAIVGRLVTSAVAGNRFLEVRYADGNGSVIAAEGIPVAIAASQTVVFGFNLGRGQGQYLAAASAFGPLPAVVLEPGRIVSVHIVGADVGDQLDRLFITADRFSTQRQQAGKAARRRGAVR